MGKMLGVLALAVMVGGGIHSSTNSGGVKDSDVVAGIRTGGGVKGGPAAYTEPSDTKGDGVRLDDAVADQKGNGRRGDTEPSNERGNGLRLDALVAHQRGNG